MIDIPVVTINERSPYEVICYEQNSFLFKTQYGIKYNVGFSKDQLLFSEGEGYHFFIINKDRSHFKHDPLLYQTIEAIIEVFFMQKDTVMIYVCDMLDGRQANRSRLFSTWFDRYPNKHLYTFVNKTITCSDISYYGAIILKKSHPEHDLVVNKFVEYIDELDGKILPDD